MAGLGWLHLSDLHVGTTGTLWQRPQYREEIERDLVWLRDRVGAFDVILVAGDLAATGTETEYGVVTEVLASLQDFLARLGPRPALLAVPGNHDLVRAAAGVAPKPATWETKREVFFEDHKHPFRRAVTAAFTPFLQWIERWHRERPGNVEVALRKGLLPGDFVATITK
ncbi:metallophosphoesterase [Polyangium spumosum]|nr:metallophosphoesterase [Polyangium spumosum]